MALFFFLVVGAHDLREAQQKTLYSMHKAPRDYIGKAPEEQEFDTHGEVGTCIQLLYRRKQKIVT
jgi:hypothetical protein